MDDIAEPLGCRYPIIQGAMSVMWNPEVVAAASEADGYVLPATGFQLDPDLLVRQIQAAKKIISKPFGANLMAPNPAPLRFAEVLMEGGVPTVTSSVDRTDDFVSPLRPNSVRLLNVEPNVGNEHWEEEAGGDVQIAEVSEWGGIQGYLGAGTIVPVPLVADAVNSPVVAAGKIRDARGYRAVFGQGEKGAEIATSLGGCRETPYVT